MPTDQPAWRARIQARLASTLQPVHDDVDLPIQMTRDAIAAARALDDERVLLDVIHLGMAAMMTYGDPDERRPLNETAAGLAAGRDTELSLAVAMRRLLLVPLERAHFVREVIDVAEIAVDGREAHVGDLIELLELGHDVRAELAA